MPVRAFVLAIALLLLPCPVHHCFPSRTSAAKRDRLKPRLALSSPAYLLKILANQSGLHSHWMSWASSPKGGRTRRKTCHRVSRPMRKPWTKSRRLCRSLRGCLNTGGRIAGDGHAHGQSDGATSVPRRTWLRRTTNRRHRDPRSDSWLGVSEVQGSCQTLRVGAVVTQGVLYGDGAKGSPQRVLLDLRARRRSLASRWSDQR